MALEPEAVVASRRLYAGRTISLRVDDIRLTNGVVGVREVIEHPGSVAVVPLADASTVILVRQYRHATGRVLLEIPAGTRHVGEDPLACVARELREETGHRAAHFEHLTGFYPAPGLLSEYLDVYLARELTPDPLAMDEDEQIEMTIVPLAQALAYVRAGIICDAKSVIGLLLAAQRLGVAFPSE